MKEAMRHFELMESLEIGNDAIDGAHREMVSIMRATKEAILSEDLDLSRKLLGDLTKETIRHFKEEEDLLEKAGYEDLGKHAQFHQSLIKRIKTVKADCENFRNPERLLSCFDEMTRFMVDDIVRGDLAFKSFLQVKGLARR